MFLRRNTRWKLTQAFIRFRTQIAWVVFCLTAVLFCSAIGVFDDFEQSVVRIKYLIRGTVEPDKPISVVQFDDAFQKQRSIPYDPATIFDVIDRIASDGPSLIIIALHPGLVGATSADLKCNSRAFFYGAQRPDWLPEECRWGEASDPQEALKLFESKFAEAPFSIVNWSGEIGTISATHLLDRQFLPGAFDDHTVIVDLIPKEFAPLHATPFGAVQGQLAFAEEISARMDGRTVSASPWLSFLLLVLAVLLGGMSPRTRFPKVAFSVGALLLAGISLYVFRFGIVVWFFSPQLVHLSTFLSRRFVPERFDRSQREAESRLRDAIAATSKRRPKHLANESAFWDVLMERASRNFVNTQSSVAELKPGDWWIEFRSFHKMDEGHISERRRDIRRAPYQKPYSTEEISTSKGYHTSSELKTIFVPLHDEGVFVGFWMLHSANPESLLDVDGPKIRRIAGQLAFEIRMHQLDVASPNALGARELNVDALAKTALATIDQLQTDRRTLDNLVEHTDVGLMIIDQFGDVVYENASMSKLLTVDAEHSRFEDIIASITDDPIDNLKQNLVRAFEFGEPFDFPVRLKTDSQLRVISFRFFPIKHEKDTRQPVYHVSVSAFDVTRFVALEGDRVALAKRVASRARDSLQASKAYIASIPKSSQSANIAAGLESVVGDFRKAVADFQMLVDPSFSGEQDALFSLQSVVRGAILAAEQGGTLPTLQTKLPDEVVSARGSADVIQRAIRLLIVDAISLSSGAPNLQIGVSEEGREVIVRVSIENSTIPNAMLQRLLETNEGAEQDDQRLAVARDFIQANHGDLEASTSEEGLLEFTVRLPRDDESF